MDAIPGAAAATTRILLATDLDGTLLGNDDALLQFAQWFERHQHSVTLAYATGRLFDDVCRLIDRTALPAPHAIIGAVGTNIRLYGDAEGLADWPSTTRLSWDPHRIRSALRDLPFLSLQPPNVQTDFKVSFYGIDLSIEQLAGVERRLAGAGIAFDLIYSSRRDLDVLPHRTNKGKAVLHLARRLEMNADRVIVCGDTGNDVAMFSEGFRGVVVGNAYDELKALRSDRIYVSSQHFAAGVLEGLKFWEKEGVVRGPLESQT